MGTLCLVISLFLVGHAQTSSTWLVSKTLGDTIEVIQYANEEAKENAALFYVLDGRKMLQNGLMDSIMTLEHSMLIPKFRYVLVSTVIGQTNPIDKRADYFFCNANYLTFFEQELIPMVENNNSPIHRYLLGVSFGGLCGAYFSTATDAFSGYALLSPITYPCPDLWSQMAFSSNRGARFLISTGKNDAEQYVGPLSESLQTQGHQVELLQTKGGHDFANWMNQLPQIMNHFEH